MALIDVMRYIAREEWGWPDRDIDNAISRYIEAGTMTPAERQALLPMNHGERAAWAARRVEVDAVPALVWDFNGHGFFAPGEPIAKFAGPPMATVGERSSGVPQFRPEGVCPDGQADTSERDQPAGPTG